MHNSVIDVVSKILQDQSKTPQQKQGAAFAPANVALCKYWGKRDHDLNLPVTSSLSVSLGNYGSKTVIRPWEGNSDSICLNGKELTDVTSKLTSKVTNNTLFPAFNLNNVTNNFVSRLTAYLDLFRHALATKNGVSETYFRIETESNIPIGSGLASSASGFAAMVLALVDLYQWQLDHSALSILARLGSGSACRSLWQGFVEWEMGEDRLGLDSHGKLLDNTWEDFCVGLLILNPEQKSFSSREAMKITQNTSEFYSMWPKRVAKDMKSLKSAILNRDFELLGETAESNALSMHALMMTAIPPILYTEPATMQAWNKVFQLRKKGIKLYFTQDAGPNLKLLFLAEDAERVCNEFENLLTITPMDK